MGRLALWPRLSTRSTGLLTLDIIVRSQTLASKKGCAYSKITPVALVDFICTTLNLALGRMYVLEMCRLLSLSVI